MLKNFENLIRDRNVVEFFGESPKTYIRAMLTNQRGRILPNDVCHGIKFVSQLDEMVASRLMHMMMVLSRLDADSVEEATAEPES